jgi:hypothetical protein
LAEADIVGLAQAAREQQSLEVDHRVLPIDVTAVSRNALVEAEVIERRVRAGGCADRVDRIG